MKSRTDTSHLLGAGLVPGEPADGRGAPHGRLVAGGGEPWGMCSLVSWGSAHPDTVWPETDVCGPADHQAKSNGSRWCLVGGFCVRWGRRSNVRFFLLDRVLWCEVACTVNAAQLKRTANPRIRSASECCGG